MTPERPPLNPTAMVGLRRIDPELATICNRFWQHIWKRDEPALDQRVRYLVALGCGVGAGRLRQATRELVKAYAAGVTGAELDEVFALLVWMQGVPTFASEIGPSPLFGAYQLIKRLGADGASRDEIVQRLKADFGEANPAVTTRPSE